MKSLSKSFLLGEFGIEAFLELVNLLAGMQIASIVAVAMERSKSDLLSFTSSVISADENVQHTVVFLIRFRCSKR